MKQLSGKPKKCKACRSEFVPARPLQIACSPKCALDLAKKASERQSNAKAKAERKAARGAKERVKTRAEYMREAQAVINLYVRLRDRHLGCVSCDKPSTWHGQWHCSHFRSVGAAPQLRFNLWNMHKACSVCNNYLSSNHAGYRPRLIEKIGIDRVQWLESHHSAARFDIEYLKRIKRVFAKKISRTKSRMKNDGSE